MPALALLALLLASTTAAAECKDYAADPALLVELEPSASVGALSTDQQACLEQRFAEVKEQTTKNKISRVLLVNAYAYDTTMWADLVQRHLDEVDRSDPNVAYLYSFYLFNRPDSPDYEAVIQWSDLALERKDAWSGDAHVKRVEQLMKVRALAGARSWQDAAERGELDRFEELRVRTKTFAREWLDFAKEAGRNTDHAAMLCVSAASAEACGIQAEEG